MNRAINANTQDFFDRFTLFIKSADPMLVMVGLTGVLVLLALALFGRRVALMGVLLVAATFSGAMWQSLDNGSAILRWLVLALIAFNIFRLKTSPGVPLLCFLVYVLIGIGMIPFSETFTWSVQTGGLLILTSTAGVVISDTVRDKETLKRMLFIFVVAALTWFILGLATLPQILAAQGERFSGAITSATLFVMTGGMLFPIVVWGALRPGSKRMKLLFGVMAMVMLALLFVSGQRTGTISGLIGTIPVVMTRGRKATFLILGAVFLLGITGLALSVANKGQLDFVLKRFTSASNTGRTEIWVNAFEECMKSPIIGHGHGGDRAFGVKYHKPMHSAYLSAWYNAGLPGFVAYMAAFITGLWISWRTYRQSKDEELKMIAILLFGLLLTQLFGGFFETLTSPSSFPTIVLVTTFALIGRLPAIREQSPQASVAWYYDPRTKQRYLYVPAPAYAARR